MINVFRMELYRVTHSISTWILIVIYFGLYLFAGGMMGLLVGNSGLAQTFQEELLGISDSAVTDFAELFNSCMMGNMVVLITSVFIGLHGTGHVVTGFQKNLAGSTKKWHFVVSNFLLLLLFNAVLILLGALALRIVMLVTHSSVTLDYLPELLRYAGVYLLLSTAYGMFGGMIADVTRNRVAAIAVPVVYCTAASSLVYLLLNYIVNMGLGFEEFAAEQYMPYGCLTSLILTDPTENFIKAAVSAVAVTVICMTVSVLVKRKQDVK